MLVELKYIEVEIEVEEILSQALRDGDLSVRETLSLCEDEIGMQDMLEELSPDGDDIQEYCDTKNIELEVSFEDMVRSLKTNLNQEQRASLLWFIIGMNDDEVQEEIKKIVTVEIVIPRLNDLIQVKRNIIPYRVYIDDYYFCVIDDTEINIRGYDDNGTKSYHLWMYKNKDDDEIADTMFDSYSELQEQMMKIIKGNIIFPSAESLFKISTGEKR